MEDAGQPTGIAVDMLNTILKKQSRDVENQIRPWKRCLADVKAGRVDIVPNSSYQKKRAEYSLYTTPLYKTHLVLFYRLQDYPKKPQINSLDDLSKYTVGGVLGFNYNFYNDQITLDKGAKNRQSLIDMLRAGRFNLAIAQKEVVAMLAQKNEVNLGGLSSVPDPAKPEQNFHMLVSKKAFKAKALQGFLDQGIKDLYASGKAQEIIQHHLGAF